jgi:hypothetical protein
MNERAIKLRDAFGVGREIPLNYVERPEVDGKFIESLTRDKHVVIYRSSKQGKTTLRKHCLEETDYIVISCLNSMSLDDLHGAILKAAGYRIEQTKTKTVGGKWKYGAEFKGEGNVPFLAKAQTQESYRETGADVDAHELVKEIVDEQAGRYGAFITNFSEGFQETGYEMYKWLAYVVVVSDIEELERGLRRSQVSALIKKAHPMAEKLNEGNITQPCKTQPPYRC